jgi:acyl-CoA thioesterase I
MTRISAALRLALIAAVVAATSAASAVNAPVTAASGSLYIAVGDSIAAGVGASLPRKRGYAALVDEWRRRHSQTTTLFENLAVPGETAATFRTEGQLQRLRDVAEQAIRTGNEIAIVSVTLGGNEMLALRTDGLTDRQEGLARFAGEYPAALQEIRAITGPATRIVVTTYYDLT